jgi:ATP-binding cassette subfamily B protein
MAYLERIFETMDTPVDIDDKPQAVELPPIKGEVEFRDVVFGYEPDIKILNGVSFKVKPGQSIALVGPTGAGKSTIVNLISRFYDIDSGSVSIDGYEVSDVTISSLRGQMGIMLQDPFIFSGTIEDNIRYGKLDATDEEIIAAAKAVCAHDFISEMPNGYKTVVKERGSGLSQGQKQLISLARTLISNPRILVLDEATSSVDARTEQVLQQAVDSLMEGRTSFIVAHRLSTIQKCDKIMFIADGAIAESGTHEELLAKKGRYYELYTAQAIVENL